MTNKEAIKYLIVPFATSTKSYNEYLKQKEAYELAIKAIEERQKGEWNILQKDDDGIHEIECPFCKFSKGGIFVDFRVTFINLPPFCENCGADMQKGGA